MFAQILVVPNRRTGSASIKARACSIEGIMVVAASVVTFGPEVTSVAQES